MFYVAEGHVAEGQFKHQQFEIFHIKEKHN